jgi:crotonobetainyl-CoA:carnitine CoA-transferase CaiB-like acyl-CoA transferase
MGNDHPSIVPYGVFHSADRDFIIAVGNDHQFEALREAIGLVPDERFTTNLLRVKNREPLIAKLNEIFASKPARYWIDLLAAVKIPVGPINRIDEAFALAQVLGLDPIVEIADSKSVANPIDLSESPRSYRLPPPALQ